MAVFAFWSQEKNETGQTLSQVALSTYMAIEHNYKILNIATSFKDSTMEDCYWDPQKETKLIRNLTNNSGQVDVGSGIEGLAKVINSNRTSTNIISNYTRIVFNNRLDILCSSKAKIYDEYLSVVQSYPDIIEIANRSYDLVFVDVSDRLPKEQARRILEIADVIIINMTQKLRIIDEYLRLKEEDAFFNKKNILLNIGRYDKFSKYNIKNITRYIRQKKDVLVTPYNTLFFESCSEGKVANFFLNMKMSKQLDPEDRNVAFINETERTSKELLYKIQELQIRL